jgi:dephospho-CoA kinase
VAADRPIECLLITGTAGAGKSAVAKEIGEQLRTTAPGFAVIDLDALAKCDVDPPVAGFFASTLMADNLAAIWPNYLRYGVDRAILARAVPSFDELEIIVRTIPDSHWTVCRLVADRSTIVARLRARETGTAQEFLVRISEGLHDELARAALEDFAVDNAAERPLVDVAAEVLHGWRSRMLGATDEADSP